MYIDDMLRFAEKVRRYSAGIDRGTIKKDGLTYDAILRNLELIGEAATHVPPGVRDQHAAIPWRQIIATRNRLVHGYLGIDNDTLWSIISDDIEPLIAQRDAMPGSPCSVPALSNRLADQVAADLGYEGCPAFSRAFNIPPGASPSG